MKKWILSFAILVGCAANPVTGKKEVQIISTSQEIAIGEQNYSYMQQAQGGAYKIDHDLSAYVDKVGQRLAEICDRPNLPYEFVVLDNSIPNAWALPGGKIAINRGLLTELENEAELAAVLSHEIVHSAARHGAKTFERMLLIQTGMLGMEQILKDHKYETVVLNSAAIGAELIGLKYSREAELEADRYGIKYMAAAGYNPQAAVDLQKVFLRLSDEAESSWLSGILSTHPPSQERINANQTTAQAYPGGGELGEEEYTKATKRLKGASKAYENLDKGYLKLLNGKEHEALKLAEEGIAIEPGEGHLYNLKGKALARMKEYEPALKAFSEALYCNPQYYDYFLQTGLVQYQMGDLRQSKYNLERSLSFLPSSEAHHALGIIARREGNERKALEHFRMAAMADTEIGEEAEKEIARIEIPHHPQEYLTVHTEWERKGKLSIYIKNESPVPIEGLELSLTSPDLEEGQTISIRQHIEPKQTLLKFFSFNRDDPRHPKIQVEILSAELSSD